MSIFRFNWGELVVLGERVNTRKEGKVWTKIQYRLYADHGNKRLDKKDWHAEYEGNRALDKETAFIYLLPEDLQKEIMDKGLLAF